MYNCMHGYQSFFNLATIFALFTLNNFFTPTLLMFNLPVYSSMETLAHPQVDDNTLTIHPLALHHFLQVWAPSSGQQLQNDP